jgi:two-component system, NarL family, response regulator DegU
LKQHPDRVPKYTSKFLYRFIAMKTIKVVLVDDHGIVRNGIKSTLSDAKNIKVIGEASNGLEAIEVVKKLLPDVVVIDITMPEMNGIEATEIIQKKFPSVKCLILSMHDKEEYVFKSIEAGALGYLLKDTSKEEFIQAINTVAKGEKHYSTSISNVLVSGYLHKVKNQPSEESESLLTKREKGILKLIVNGHNNREIADQLDISIRTIEVHRANIMKKLHVKNAVELVKVALEEKIV